MPARVIWPERVVWDSFGVIEVGRATALLESLRTGRHRHPGVFTPGPRAYPD